MITTDNNQELLNEMFMQPSGRVEENRFEKSAKSADCSGECSSGICRTG